MSTEPLNTESVVVADRVSGGFGDLDALPKHNVEPGEFGDLSSIPKDELSSLTTYLYRIADDGTKMPSGFRRERYVMKRVGGLFDFDEIREQCGGGNFLIIVTATIGGRMLRCVRLPIEGPPRLYVPASLESPPVPVAAEPVRVEEPAPRTTRPDEIAQAVALAITPVMQQLAEVVKAVTVAQAAPAAAPPMNPMDIFEMMDRGIRLGRESAVPQPAADTEKLLDMFERGMKLGRTTEGGKSIGEAIVEVAPRAIDAIATGLASRPVAPRVFVRRGAPAAAPGAAAAAADKSSAVVVEPGGAVVQPAAGDVAARVRWLVEYLDSMRSSGADATKVADVLEDLLSEFEVRKLASYVGEHDGQPAVNVSAALADLGQLHPAPAGLVSEDGQRWLAEFLERLAQPAEPESDDSGGSNA